MKRGKSDRTTDTTATPDKSAAARSAEKKRQTDDWLTRNLKQLYSSTVEEPVPDHFVDLISRLGEEPAGGAPKPGKSNKGR